MSHDKVDNSVRQSRDSPGTLERVSNTVARQQLEYDSQRGRLFLEESRQKAGIHAARLVGDLPAYLNLIAPQSEPTGHLNKQQTPTETPARGGIAREAHRPAGISQPALAGRATTGASIAAILAALPLPDLSRMVGAHAGNVHDPNRPDPIQPMETLIAEGRHDVPSPKRRAPAAAPEWIAQLPLKYTDPMFGDPLNASHALVTLGREGPLTKPFADSVTFNHLYSQTEASTTHQAVLGGSSQDRRPYPDSRSLRLGEEGARTRHRISNDRVIGSGFAGFSDVIGQGNQSDISGNPHTNSDRGGEWNAEDGRSSSAGLQGSAQETIAAVADEVERLRAVVRQTIDDLERARGSVQPSLPALPPNRGAFRIS
jgi:hypothetical protein